MMTASPRNIAALRGKVFDLLVVGGGIQGVGVALAGARRGLSVALVDQGDFGHAASANSLKIIHGGLRYLQHLDFLRMRESIRARSEFLRMAPHLVRPRPFLMPTTGHGLRGRVVMRAALAINDFISADRNHDLPPGSRLPRGRVVSRAECLARVPGLAEAGVDGAALWYDAQAQDSERLTWTCVRAAIEAGAVAVNYVRAVRLLRDGGRVTGAAVEDVLGGGRLEIRARVTVCAGGPWQARLVPEAAGAPEFSHGWVRAFNLVTRRPWPSDTGAALEGMVAHHDPDAVVQRGKRNLFFAPWRGGTLVGTWYKAFAGEPEACRLGSEDLDVAVAEVQAVYPVWGLQRDEVTMAHVGLVPRAPELKARCPAGPAPERGARCLAGGGGAVERGAHCGAGEPEKHTRVVTRWAGGVTGLVVVQAVKYTTGLVEGERVVRGLIGRGEFSTAAMQAPGGEAAPIPAGALVEAVAVRDWARARGLEVGEAVAAGLAARYGVGFVAVLEGAVAADVVALGEGTDVCAAEILHAMRDEQAVRLADVVLRRTGMGTFAIPGHHLLDACARIMAGELGWDPLRVAAEVAELLTFYRTRGVGP